MSKRVVFTFDDKSYADLVRLKEMLGVETLGDAVCRALTITKALEDQSAKGFTQFFVRHPGNGKEKAMVIPEPVKCGEGR